jgi:long-chain acyl-CoA synthetase
MLTHGNLRANIDQMQAVEAVARHRDDTTLGVLPLFHIFGLNVVLDPALLVGATVVLVERFDPTAAVESISEHGSPPSPDPHHVGHLHPDPRPSPRRVRHGAPRRVGGGASSPSRSPSACSRRFGLAVTEGYGLTESAPGGGHLGDRDRGSVGVDRSSAARVSRCVWSTTEGDDVLVGDAGEIWVRGPNVFPGYWNDPRGHGRVLDADGWLHTGDIAVIDDDGYLFIVDRAKDLIIVSGFNVYPAEVEEVLVEHPAVAEAAVVGVEHPHTGEAVKAYVVSPGRVPRSRRTTSSSSSASASPATSARPRSGSSTDPQGLGRQDPAPLADLTHPASTRPGAWPGAPVTL